MYSSSQIHFGTLGNILFPTDTEEAYWGQLSLSNLYDLNIDSY